MQEYRAVNKEIRQFYFGKDVINMGKSFEYVDMLSDINFGYAIDKTAKLHATKSKGKTFYARWVTPTPARVLLLHKLMFN